MTKCQCQQRVLLCDNPQPTEAEGWTQHATLFFLSFVLSFLSFLSFLFFVFSFVPFLSNMPIDAKCNAKYSTPRTTLECRQTNICSPITNANANVNFSSNYTNVANAQLLAQFNAECSISQMLDVSNTVMLLETFQLYQYALNCNGHCRRRRRCCELL